MPEDKSNAFTELVHTINNHKYREAYCFFTGLTSIMCKISLQFCCEFIDNNRSNIYAVSDIAGLIKLPTSIVFALHLGLNLAGYKSQNDKDEPKNPVQIIGSLAFLAQYTIGILMQTKIIHFLAGNNKDIISYISLTSAILFLFSEFISCYYTWKKYLDNKDPKKSAECWKSAIVSTVVLSLGLLNSMLKRMDIATIPMNLGGSIICNFNLSVFVSIVLGFIYLKSNVDKFMSLSNNGIDPSTELDGAHPTQHNGTAVEVG